jgi:hypothetical protein
MSMTTGGSPERPRNSVRLVVLHELNYQVFDTRRLEQPKHRNKASSFSRWTARNKGIDQGLLLPCRLSVLLRQIPRNNRSSTCITSHRIVAAPIRG